jgi:hypothetical protein
MRFVGLTGRYLVGRIVFIDQGSSEVNSHGIRRSGKRGKALEDEVAWLKVKLDSTRDDDLPWWERISGIFADDPAFEEAMKLGREWRESFRPKPPRKKRKNDRPGHRSPQSSRKTGVRGKPKP